MTDISELASLPGQLLQNNPSLMSLEIWSCADVHLTRSRCMGYVYLSPITPYIWLRNWVIFQTSIRLRSWYYTIVLIEDLSTLRMEQCINLKSIQDLRSLAILQIDSCPNLRSDIRGLHPLRCLQISSCVVAIFKFHSIFHKLRTLNDQTIQW